MAPRSKFIWTIYSNKNFDVDDVNEGQKIRWENPKKFIHELNKREWVGSFLTAHQHIEGHFSAIIGVKIKNEIHLTTTRRSK